jgi:predicted nucleic acid-binding protein
LIATSFFVFFIDGVPILEHLQEKLVTSANVIEEVTYVLIKQKVKEIEEEMTHYELLSFLRENPAHIMEIFGEIKEDIRRLLEILNIMVLEPANYEEMWNVIERYGLLPNDALIVATCENHGITKIATFDEDFKKVDFLETFQSPLK